MSNLNWVSEIVGKKSIQCECCKDSFSTQQTKMYKLNPRTQPKPCDPLVFCSTCVEHRGLGYCPSKN